MEPIVFGKKRALLVKDPRRRAIVINQLREWSAVRCWEKGNFWSADAYEKLRQQPYLVRMVPVWKNRLGEVRDSRSYFLYLGTFSLRPYFGSDRSLCFFIEKTIPLEKARIYQVRLRFRRELFSGTLFNGTMALTEEERPVERKNSIHYFKDLFPGIHYSVRKEKNPKKRFFSAHQKEFKKQNWTFLIHDLWVKEGTEMKQSLPKRLNSAQQIIHFQWQSDLRLDVCNMRLDTYYDYSTIQKALQLERKEKYISFSDHRVVFSSLKDPPGLEEYKVSLLKKPPLVRKSTLLLKNGHLKKESIPEKQSKNREKRNKILQVSSYPDVYWVLDPKNKEKLGAARIRSTEESHTIRNLFKEKNVTELSFPCIFEAEFMKWRPLLNPSPPPLAQ